jgi:hypothetical protein
MRVFDLILYQGGMVIECLEAVGVAPLGHRPLFLGVRKAVIADLAVNGAPVYGQRAHPQSELGDGAFGHGINVVKLHDDPGRVQRFEGAGVMVKGPYGLLGGVYSERKNNYVHRFLQKAIISYK